MSTVANVVALEDATSAWANAVADNLNRQTNRPSWLVSKVDGTQSLTTSVETALTWTAESIDTDGFHDNGVNPSRATIPVGLGGLYLVGYVVCFASNVTGTRYTYLRLNGLASPRPAHVAVPAVSSGAIATILCGSVVRRFNAGDYLEVIGWQNSGGGLAITGDNSAGLISNFFGTRLGD